MAPIDERADVRRINRDTLGSQVANALRHDILVGRRPAGQILSQQELCEEFGISRMPVRDALRQLAHEGLVISTNGGHAQVVGLTRDDIWDCYSAEALVVARATRRAAALMTQEEIDELKAIFESILRSEEAGEKEAVADLNWQFHAYINSHARSPKLLALIRAISMSIPRRYLLELPEWSSTANDDHHEMLRLIEERDLEGIEAFTSHHILDAGGHFLAYLERQGLYNP